LLTFAGGAVRRGHNRNDIHLGTGAHVACHGKGLKDRITPLTKLTVDALRCWLAQSPGTPTDPAFPTRTGCSLSRDAVERRLTRHQATAARTCPSLVGKRVTAHLLRHTYAMRLLEAGVDTTVIALGVLFQSLETARLAVVPFARIGARPAPALSPD
jgi:integrase/recombinase XerD